VALVAAVAVIVALVVLVVRNVPALLAALAALVIAGAAGWIALTRRGVARTLAAVGAAAALIGGAVALILLGALDELVVLVVAIGAFAVASAASARWQGSSDARGKRRPRCAWGPARREILSGAEIGRGQGQEIRPRAGSTPGIEPVLPTAATICVPSHTGRALRRRDRDGGKRTVQALVAEVAMGTASVRLHPRRNAEPSRARPGTRPRRRRRRA
jgi:hypothetical protein